MRMRKNRIFCSDERVIVVKSSISTTPSERDILFHIVTYYIKRDISLGVVVCTSTTIFSPCLE
jgi:hypothetical protein